MKHVAAAMAVTLFISTFLLGQSQPNRRTFEGVITIPNAGPAPRTSIRGTVVSNETGEPLVGATVKLSPQLGGALAALLAESGGEAGATIEPVVTNREGTFFFADIVGGQYDLAVRMDGYVPVRLGERVANGEGSWLTVLPGQQRDDVRIRLSRSARIEGHIRNDAGQPLGGIPVGVILPGPLYVQAVQTTADDGVYDLEGFPPGRYLLIAGWPAALNGETERSFAREIAVPNTNSQTLDFSLDSTIRYSLRGSVKIADTTSAPADLSFTLGVLPPAANSMTNLVGANFQYNPKTSTFEVPNLLPGIYRLSVRLVDSSKPAVCDAADVVVSGADVTGLELKLATCLR